MDNSNKPKRLEDQDEDGSKGQPEAARIKTGNQQSDVSISGGPEDSEPIPVLPSCDSRDHRKQVFGRLVVQTFAPNGYEYEPLSRDPSDDQIRLLILHRGDLNDKIHCSFQVYPFSKAEDKYKALSYCWGTEGDNCEIRIRTVAPRKPCAKGWKRAIEQVRPQKFYIRPRLHDALMHFRLPDRDICLWVDALCINQEDEVEKTQQVQKMARIYSAAANVLIWLGAGNKKCEEALEFIEEILDLKTFEAKVEDESSAPKWAALVELMRQDWFSRRWVIQEVALARDATIYYNDKHVNWKEFANAIAMFATRLDDIKQLFSRHREYDYNPEYLGDIKSLSAYTLVEVTTYHVRTSCEALNGLERLSTLEELVSKLLKFEASDPRDTIYALLSICKKQNGPHKELAPNPEKSIIEVYRDFTQYCVSSSPSIDIILRHWAPAAWSKSATLQHPQVIRKKRIIKKNHETKEKPRVNAKMPSWVPLLNDSPFGAPRQVLPSRVNGNSLVGLPNFQVYEACGGIYKEVRFENIPLFVTQPTESRAISLPQDDRTATLLEHPPRLCQTQEEGGSIHAGMPAYSSVESPSSATSSSSSESAHSVASEPLARASSSSSSESAHSVASEPLNHQLVNAFFMFVTGIHIDTVTKVSARIAAGVLTQECLEMGGWEGRDGQQKEIPVALWQTLVAGRDPWGGQCPSFYNRACLSCFDLAEPSGDINLASLIAKPWTPSFLKEFLKRVQSIVWNRPFVRSGRKNLFGLGPKGTRVNDLICILYGCSVPVILRAQQDPHSLAITHYEIVGECFIYGMMDGEAVDNIDHKNDTREFKLG